MNLPIGYRDDHRHANDHAFPPLCVCAHLQTYLLRSPPIALFYELRNSVGPLLDVSAWAIFMSGKE